MGQSRDEWLERTGGFRIGETGEQFKARASEIDRLETLLKSGTLKLGDEFDSVQRQICALKGIDFDADD